MKDFYKELLAEIDDIGKCADNGTAHFTYGFIWGKATLARELQLISADQMEHLLAESDRTFDDWLLYISEEEAT
ncbi:hypothetical protein [Ruminococcus sp.]|uniref:hypothetical protein n=1 Tax=Ruminococcus sp. TaxID=41978 RepID=UPI001B6443D6|nr:hypothetical protein [Ruminococcus sp.]MBP5433403.1 hypothetical protein [Ruminococcus sp.]